MLPRLHLFEFEDQEWFPAFLREGMMDNLTFFFQLTGAYNNAIPLLQKALKESRTSRIIDLCSGAGGPLLLLQSAVGVKITLTDKFPPRATTPYPAITYLNQPVDAMNVPREIQGLRTIFTALHHFHKKEVLKIFKDATEKNAPVAVFEGSGRSWLMAILIFPLVFLLSFFCTPFIKPFKIKRIIFTYLIPLIPFFTAWDGFVSFLRLYSYEEMLEMAVKADSGYHWEAGEKRSFLFFRMQYLIGWKTAEAQG